MYRRIAVLFVVGAAALAACKKAEEPAPAKVDTGPPAPAAPDPLAEAVRNIARVCTVTDEGQVRDCAAGVEDELKQAESARGIIPSLELHCSLLSDAEPKIRAVAANRIGGLALHGELKDRGTDALLDCLVRNMGGRWDDKNIWQAERITRAATFLATARDQHLALLRFLFKAPPRIKHVGYECLWPNGRMKVFDALAEAAADQDPTLRRAVVMGFAYVGSLATDELEKVCGLLAKLLDDKDGEVAGAAAQRLADHCPASRARVVEQIATRARGKLDPGFVSALERLHQATTVPPPAPLLQKARGLLARIAGARTQESAIRAMALQALHRVDPAAGTRLARRLARDRDPQLRQLAAPIAQGK